jgi:uncharacterized damage-inducible protein DinB
MSLKDDALPDVDRELDITREFLTVLPDDKLTWQPHAKSMTLGRLGMHLAELPGLATRVLATDSFDMATRPAGPRPVATTRADALALFDENAAALRAALAKTDDAALRQNWTMTNGDKIIWNGPRAAIFRTRFLSHLVHHRAQLGVFYRLLDVPVPNSFGPTADDKGFR